MEAYEPITIERKDAEVVKSENISIQDDASANELPKWLSPTEFYEQYKDSLPVKAKASCSSSSSDGRIVNVLSILQDDIVELHIEELGEKYYTVIKNSFVQYGLLYNPNNNLQEAIKGTTFDTVESLMSLSSLPQFVCATKAHTGDTAESSVAKGELLVVHKMSQSRASFFKTEALKALVVYSVSTKRKKKLLPNCEGVFTTMPHLVKLPLVEIYQLVSSLRSFKAMIFIKSSNIDIPQKLTTKIVTLKPSGVGACLHVTFPDNDRSSNTNIAHVPVQSPLKLRALVQCSRLPLPLPAESTEDRKDQAVGDSSPTEYQYMKPATSDDDGTSEYEDVTRYCKVRLTPASKSSEYHQLHLAQNAPGRISHAEEADGRSNFSSTGGVEVSSPHVCQAQAPVSNEGEVAELRLMVQELQRKCDTYERRMQDMAEQIEHLRISHKHCVGVLLDKLTQHCSHPPELQQSSGTSSAQEVHPSSGLQSDNRSELLRLNVAQVIELLDAMELSQYREVFEKEQICGAVLAAIDDSLLDLVLGVASELHRNRIMDVVSGAVSIRHYGVHV